MSAAVTSRYKSSSRPCGVEQSAEAGNFGGK